MADEMVDPAVQTWLADAARGDAQAWRRIVETYTPRVFGLIVHQTGDRELAEEIAQATFVSLVENLKGYDESGRFEAWLFRIAMNRLRDEMRRRKRHARTMDMSPAEGEDESEWAGVQTKVVDLTGTQDNLSPLDQMARKEQVERLRLAVASMSEADRAVLTLRHTAGLSFAEIAKTLGEPLGTVLARGHRALAKLKKTLEQEMESDRTAEPERT